MFPGRSVSRHVVASDHKEVPGTLHSPRHTFAKVAVEVGIPEEVVGQLLNHASKTIAGQRYVGPKLDFPRSAVEMIVAGLQRRLAGWALGSRLQSANLAPPNQAGSATTPTATGGACTEVASALRFDDARL